MAAEEKKSNRPTHIVKAITDRGEWPTIGVGFMNNDGSINIMLNFIPTDPKMKLQIRENIPKD